MYLGEPVGRHRLPSWLVPRIFPASRIGDTVKCRYLNVTCFFVDLPLASVDPARSVANLLVVRWITYT